MFPTVSLLLIILHDCLSKGKANIFSIHILATKIYFFVLYEIWNNNQQTRTKLEDQMVWQRNGLL